MNLLRDLDENNNLVLLQARIASIKVKVKVKVTF
tara:strand:+ start:859 stop:960 length:102 start_codon:yes stop_codon:yes gene_type:complete